MPIESGLYEGRKGQRRLRAIEKQTEKIKGEFQNVYLDTPEMRFLQEDVLWEGASGLLFAMAMRNVNFTWNGMRDYGFIRLCAGWIRDRELESMTTEQTGAMIKQILPIKMYSELGEELSALEIF